MLPNSVLCTKSTIILKYRIGCSDVHELLCYYIRCYLAILMCMMIFVNLTIAYYIIHVSLSYNCTESLSEPPFHVRLLNSSPRVSGGVLLIDFEASMPIVSAQCFLTGQKERNCELILCVSTFASSVHV